MGPSPDLSFCHSYPLQTPNSQVCCHSQMCHPSPLGGHPGKQGLPSLVTLCPSGVPPSFLPHCWSPNRCLPASFLPWHTQVIPCEMALEEMDKATCVQEATNLVTPAAQPTEGLPRSEGRPVPRRALAPPWSSSAPHAQPSPFFWSLPACSYPPQPPLSRVPHHASSRALLLPGRAEEIPNPTSCLWLRSEVSQGESSECRTGKSGFESASALCRVCDRDRGQLALPCPGLRCVK